MDSSALRRAFDTAIAHHKAGDLEKAESLLREILRHEPNQPDVHIALFQTLQLSARVSDALDHLRRAISLRPAEPTYYYLLAEYLLEAGTFDEALAAFNDALRLRPEFPEALFSLGTAMATRGMYAPAIGHLRRAVALRPDYWDALANLAAALAQVGELDEAITVCQNALAARPDDQAFYYTLGMAARETGRLDQAIAAYRKSLQHQPDSRRHGDLLFTLHFHPSYDRALLAREHRQWYESYARGMQPGHQTHTQDRNSDRRLKVGYVAAFLGAFPLGRLILPLIENHNPAEFEVALYTDDLRKDWVGDRLAARADICRKLRGISEEQIAQLVREDKIDILVDLSMHTVGGHLLAFAHKPAPVQVTYLAYPSTTGLRAIDYRFTDNYLDPPGGDDSVYAERSWRLPRCYWCYPPPPEAPDVSMPAFARNGHITFGCLNEFSKASDAALSTWAQLLRAIPNARLILHAKPGNHRQRVSDLFARAGVEIDRVRFVGRLRINDYFAVYHHIDIALDPFPWAGGTTTCDALWMGAPVISVVGETAVGRGGLSILSNVGLGEFAVERTESYIETAVQLAADRTRLVSLRSGLRDRMRASPLLDGRGFARDVETAYRQMWQSWCQTVS